MSTLATSIAPTSLRSSASARVSSAQKTRDKTCEILNLIRCKKLQILEPLTISFHSTTARYGLKVLCILSMFSEHESGRKEKIRFAKH